jgi:hypothetical protein
MDVEIHFEQYYTKQSCRMYMKLRVYLLKIAAIFGNI